jgi:hypothetical protein
LPVPQIRNRPPAEEKKKRKNDEKIMSNKKVWQTTLFGAWKVGTPEQQQPIIECVDPRVNCFYCDATCSNVEAYNVHKHLRHIVEFAKEQKLLEGDRALSMASLSLLDEVRLQQPLPKDDSDGDDDHDDPGKVQAEGLASGKRTRGQPKRLRYKLKAKCKAISLIERVRDDMIEAADAAGIEPPSLQKVLGTLAVRGLGIPQNNL